MGKKGIAQYNTQDFQEKIWPSICKAGDFGRWGDFETFLKMFVSD